MKKILILLISIVSASAWGANYSIGSGETIDGLKRIDIARRMERHMRPDQLRKHKLMSITLSVAPEDYGSVAELWVNGHMFSQQFINRSSNGQLSTVVLDSPQTNGNYHLVLSGRMFVHSIQAQLKSLQPSLGATTHLTNFHVGRWDSVRRDIAVDSTQSVGEFVLTARSNDVELKQVFIVFNHGGVQELRQYREFDIDEGSNLVIRFPVNYQNYIRSIIVRAKSDSPFGSEAELFVSARYWE